MFEHEFTIQDFLLPVTSHINGHVKTRTKPFLRAYLDHNFPNTAPLTRELKQRLLDESQVFIVPVEGEHAGTIGGVIDYRIRAFGSPEVPNLAIKAVQEYIHEDEDLKLFAEFFRYSEGVLDRAYYLQREGPLSTPQEVEVIKCCYVFALLDQLYRVGPEIVQYNWPIKNCSKFEDLLSIASNDSLRNIGLMSRLFFRSLYEDVLVSERFVPAPTFNSIIWGDGDFIIGNCLYDSKCYGANLRNVYIMFKQLACYSLLDWSDRNKIQEVGIYFARDGVVVKWTLESLLSTMAGKLVSVEEERSKLAEVVKAGAKSFIAASKKKADKKMVEERLSSQEFREMLSSKPKERDVKSS